MRRIIAPVIGFLLLTALFQLVRHDVAGLVSTLPEATREEARIATGIGFWLGTAWLASALLSATILDYARRRHSATQLPKLLIDVGKLVVYFIAILIIISQVFEKSLSGLLATSGFLAAFIGLAVQKTITDAFAGLALNTDQVIKIGDWIETSTNITGRVEEITWRATHLVTLDGRKVVIPNSMLVANQLTNLNAPYRHFRLTKTIRTDYNVPAERVIGILQSAMEATEGVLREPQPQVLIEEVLNGGILFSMNYWVLDYARSALVSREVIVNALKFLDRAGFAPSLPRQDILLLDQASRQIDTVIDTRTVLRRTPIFQSFSAAALDALEREVRLQEFVPGSIIVREGDAGASLFIVVAGLLEASKHGPAGELRILGKLVAGDVLGEMSLLTGAARSATVTARTQATLLEIRKDQLEPILADRPDAIAELGRLQAERLARNEDALALSPEEQREVRAVGMAVFLGRKIRRFFSRVEA